MLFYIIVFAVGLVLGAVAYYKIWGECSDGNSQEVAVEKHEYAQEKLLVVPPSKPKQMPLRRDMRSCDKGDIMQGTIPWHDAYQCEPNSTERNAYYGGEENCSKFGSRLNIYSQVVKGTTDLTTYHKLW